MGDGVFLSLTTQRDTRLAKSQSVSNPQVAKAKEEQQFFENKDCLAKLDQMFGENIFNSQYA